jgi:hypothetical protein
MAFDLASAKPVEKSAFDLSTAKPVDDQQPKGSDALDGMSKFERFRAGYGKAAVDMATGAKQRVDDLAAWIEDKVPALASLDQRLGMQTAAQIRDQGRAAEDERKRLDAPLMADSAGRAGHLTGSVVDALPAGAVPGAQGVVGAAVVGAGLGALDPTGTNDSAVENAAWGAIGGAAGHGLLKGASRVVKPAYDSAVNKLMTAGVPLTPGQMMGGAWKRVEDALTSVPIVGDSIKGAQKRAFEAFNNAVGNEALAPIGAKLPPGLNGNDSVAWTRKALQGAYDDVLQRIGTVQADPQFAQEIGQLQTLFKNGNVGKAAQEQFDAIVQNQVLGRFQGQNTVTAETLKAMESELGKLSDKLRRAPDYDHQEIGDAVMELQASLRSLVQRAAGPDEAADLAAANRGWAMFTRMRRAASSVGADDGTFTPAQFLNAVKAGDRSAGKGAFAEGRALGQDLAQAGKSVMGSSLPDSGTSFRTFMQHPTAVGTGMAAAGLPAALLYTQPAQRVVRVLMTARPQAAGPLSKALEAATPAGGAAGAVLLPRMRPGAPAYGQE